MNAGFAVNIVLAAAVWVILWTTLATTRPERPPANADSWQIESFAMMNRHFDIVIAVHVCWFLSALAMTVVAWHRG